MNRLLVGMHRNLIALVAVSVAFCCKTSNAEVTLCGNDLLPGINKLVYSVDVTQLDLLPKDHDALNGFKTPIIDFTCENGKKFTNTYNGVTYSVPDQILQVVMNPSGKLDAQTKIYNTISDVQESLGVEVGLDVSNPLYGSFSSSNTYKRSENTFKSYEQFISSADASIAGFRADVDYHWKRPFNQDILHYVDNILPDNYATHPKEYQQFIDIYGTHYFSVGVFGGRLRLEITTNKELLKSMTSEEINANIEASYKMFLKSKGAVNRIDKQIHENFLSFSRNQSYYYGGRANLLDEENSWKTWWDTVASNPWLYGGQLAPIDQVLIEDSTKKAGIKLAVKCYLITKALPTYFTRLDNFIRNNKYGLDRANELQRRLTNLMAQITPLDPINSETLLTEIEAYINPPKMWFQNTRLCYGCPGEDNVCPKKSTVCTGVNEFEKARSEDFFSSISGASSIGLFSTPPLAWLNNTKICNKWSMPTQEQYLRCANPNEYTNDLDARFNGGQKPIWFTITFDFDLVETPGWFLNTRICSGYIIKSCIAIWDARNISIYHYNRGNFKLSLETDYF